MNSLFYTRRLIGLFATLAIASLALLVAGLALTSYILPLFAATVSTLTALVVARDYAPRPVWVPRRRGVAPIARYDERMPLAA